MDTKAKRLLSFAIALILVVSLLPGKLLVAEAAINENLCACGCGTAATKVEWKDLNAYLAGNQGGTAGYVTTNGHYYLSGPLAISGYETLEIYADMTLDLRGNDITPAEGYRTMFVNANCDITILDTVGGGEIYGGDVTGLSIYGGAIYVAASAELNMLSGTIRGGKAVRGGNLTVEGTAIIGGKARIIEGYATQRGGNILTVGGTTTITDYAKVLDGEAEAMGGNLYVTAVKATLQIAGHATVAGGNCNSKSNGANIASMYGNVVIADNAVVDAGVTGSATSVQITGYQAKASTLTVSGGTVYGKTQVEAKANDYVCSVSISGAPVIKHISLASGVVINPTSMTDGASVTVEAVDAAITDTLTNAQSYLPYFHAYNDRSSVVVKENMLQIAAVQSCPCGCGKSLNAVSWTSWAGGAISESGHYQLSAAKTLSGTVTIPSGVHAVLDLNGNTLTSASSARAFTVNGTLSIVDTGATGKITGATITSTASADYGGTIRVEQGAVLNIYGGTIADGTAARGGNIHSAGTINMYGGTVTNGKSSRGNNINLGDKGVLRIYGGTVSVGTNYTASAANIYATWSNTTVYICGGTVSGPSAVNSVQLLGANLYISGGTISGGEIKTSPYDSYTNKCRVVVAGGTVNSAINISGDSYPAEVIVTGGELKGAVTISDAKSFHLSGAPKISSLTLGSDVKIKISDLSTAASVTLTSSPVVFTTPTENPEQYTGVFKKSGKTCMAVGDFLAMAGSTTTGTSGSSNNITWTLLDSTALVFAGTGKMSDYNSTNLAPWSGSVTEAYVGEGITQIGHWAFYNNGTIDYLYLPASLNNIRSYVFRQSTLSKVVYAGTRDQWNAITITSTNTELLNIVDTAKFHCVGGSDGATVVPVTPSVNTTSWSVNGNTLTISGTGRMPGYYYDTAATRYNGTPWSAYKDQITKVVISSGVTAIGNWAFYGLKNVTSVTIPSTVTTIGDNAFRDCAALQSINISNVTKVGNSAFRGCSALTTVTAGSALTYIGGFAFFGCGSLTGITGLSKVKTVGNRAFDGCTSLTAFGDWFADGAVTVSGVEYTDIVCENGVWYNADKTILLRVPGGYSGSFTVPNGVIEIADYAFADCVNITAVIIADTVEVVGGAAFDGCIAVETIHIGTNVVSTKANAFANCNSLQTFTGGSSAEIRNNSIDSTGALASYGKTVLYRAPSGLQKYTVSDDVTGIALYAFANNKTVEEVTLGAKTTSIGSRSFIGTDNLKVIKIPTSVTSISKEAFEASGVQDVFYSGTLAQWNAITIEDKNEPLLAAKLHCNIAENAACGANAKYTLDTDGLLTITGTGAIDHYTAQKPAPWAEYADMIVTVELSEGITAIGNNAFSGCTALENVIYDGTETQWGRLAVGTGNEAFTNAKVSGFTAPRPAYITITTLPTKLDYMVGETVDTTGMVATMVYHDETTAVLSAEDYTVSYELFPGKTTVTVTSAGVTGTFQVNVSAAGTTGAVNWSLTADGKLTIFGNGAMDYETVAWAAYMSAITSVEIREGVTGRLSKQSFRNAVNLQSASLPEGITWISATTFYNCTSLTELVLPSSVTYIGDNAFSKSTNLKTITFGENIAGINGNVFTNCTALETIYFAGTLTQWNDLASELVLPANTTVICAKKAVVGVDVTMSETVKLEYQVNEELDLTGIVVTVHYDNDTSEVVTDYTAEYDFTTGGTKTVTLKYQGQTVRTYDVTVLLAGVSAEGFLWHISAEGVLTITGEGEMTNYTQETPAPWAAYAEEITTVLLSDGITAIGSEAFAGCANMTSVNVPKTVTAIGENAFAGCAGLTEVTYDGLESGWATITIGNGNEALTAANRTYAALYGDASGDGLINALDATRILKYVAGWDVVIDLAAADVNGDGYINALDATRILKYVAGWDVALGPKK